MSLKVTRYGKAYIEILDVTDPEEDATEPVEPVRIYRGAPDIDCVIEAMGFYYGEDDIEHLEEELPQGRNPLDATLGEDEYEIDENTEIIPIDGPGPLKREVGELLGDVDNYCEEIANQASGNDYPNDDD